ncbi:MAG: Asp-tRNA(Asn)/Glu-tRNA(Gln) amidotransferase subunit GatB [Candidatus Omnitrophota bacterium]
MDYEAVIGLEVHVQLKTKTKAFCGCSTEFGRPANSQACPVCLGFPGSLPVLNQAALEFAIKAGLALNCRVWEFTKFDRKHYYYPDLPKNYQISQYDQPVATNGFLDIEVSAKPKRIRIKRVHLEEDAGKLIHQESVSLVDYNRAGVPLLEIVSEPDIHSPEEARAYLTDLKSIVEYLEISDCDMEKGSLRCDANISLREKGANTLGVKAEIKNMNSFKGVKDALTFEIERQNRLLKGGEIVIQETRLWDAHAMKTISMRSKEEAMDYRYFPEPDLPPFLISREKVAFIKSSIPELPQEKVPRLMKDYALFEVEAKILASSKDNAAYAEKCFLAYGAGNKKIVANWLVGAMFSEANSRGLGLSGLRISPEALISLIKFVEGGQISNLAAKFVLTEMIDSKKPAAEIIKEKNLGQISDVDALEKHAEDVIKENLKVAEDYRQGKANAIMFLVGQVMKKSAGKANPKVVQEILKKKLS